MKKLSITIGILLLMSFSVDVKPNQEILLNSNDSNLVQTLQKEYLSVIKKVDSLDQKITSYEISEGYFQAILSSHSALFSAIIGAFCLIFGSIVTIVNITAFTKKVKDYKKQTESQINKVEDSYKDFMKYNQANQKNIKSAFLHLWSLSASIHRDKKQDAQFFFCTINALRYLNEVGNDEAFTLKNLKEISDLIELNSTNPKLKQDVKELDENLYLPSLQKLMENENVKIKVAACKIYEKISNIIK